MQVIRQRSLSVTIASGLACSLMADEALELAFSNVLGNAIKYTPDGGSITLAAETRDHVARLIQDTGIGIVR